MPPIRTESRFPWKAVIAFTVVALAVLLIARHREEVEAVSEGITGNQALREKARIGLQLDEIQSEHDRALEEAMGH